MNILLINHYAGSPKMGMEFRPYYLAREWIKDGHKVTIVAGDFSHLRKENPVVEKDLQESHVDGIKYIWLKTGSYEGNGIKRAKTMAHFCRKLYKYKKQIIKIANPDIVISSSTYPIDSYPAYKIAKAAKAGYIHEVHDMWPSTLYEIGGMSKRNPFVVIMQMGENHAYKKCDALVSMLSEAGDYMENHGLDPKKFNVVRNGILTDEWEGSNRENLPEDIKSKFEELKAKEKFIVGYFGGFAISNNLDFIIDVAEELKDNDHIHFVLLGEGVLKKDLVHRTEKSGLTNITFLPKIKKNLVPNVLEHYDIIFISFSDSPLYRFGINPNKMYDAMMAGKPILMSVNAKGNLVEEAKAGIVVGADDTKAAKEAVLKFKEMNETEFKRYGENGKKEILENYTYHKLAKKFEKIMSDIRR